MVLLPMTAGLARPRNTETSGPLAGYKHVPGCRGKKNPVPGDTGCLLGVTPRYLPSKGPVRGGEPKLTPGESSAAVRGDLIPSKTQKQRDFCQFWTARRRSTELARRGSGVDRAAARNS